MTFASFAASPPLLHTWDGGKTFGTGGFGPYHLQAIFDFGRKNLPPKARMIETGAGCSTICFLYLEPSRLVSIAPDPALFDRIKAYCDKNGVDETPLDPRVDGSEWVLPELAKTARARAGAVVTQSALDTMPSTQNMAEVDFDFALIDGWHNWPTSMLDFFYINFMLKKGGFLLLDDIHLHSVAELFRFISYDTKNFRLRSDLGKLQIFEKITDQRRLDEWHVHPYTKPMSWRADLLLHYYAKFVIRAKALMEKK